MKKIKLLALLLVSVLSVNMWGESYTITFKTATDDGTDEIKNTTQSSTVISDGTKYVSGFTSNCSKAFYNGKSGVKLGNSKNGGTLEFTIAADYQSNIKSIKVKSAKYGTESASITLYSGSTSLVSGKTPGTDFTHSFATPTKVTSIKLTSGSKRAYITEITLEPEEATKCEDPTFSVAGGTYTTAKSVTLSCTTTGAAIHYTIDGSDPTSSSPTYSTAITVNKDMTIRAIATKNGLENSEVVSAAYTINYTVTFNKNGHGTAPSAITPVKYNETIGEPTALTETGYTFGGWYKEQTCTNQWTFASDKVTGNTTLYAKWTANQTIITLSAPNADISQGTTQVTATYDKAMPTATMPQRTGYTFNGYFDAESGGTKYYSNTGSSAKTWNKEDATFTLHAQWTAKQYNITYKNQGNTTFTGTHETGYPQKHTYDQTTTLKTATRNGYNFGGWYKEPDCSGEEVKTIGPKEITDAITLYAKWTARTTTVSFDKNAGDDEVQNMPAGTIVNTFDAALTTTGVTIPTRVGYTFVGWFDSSSKKYYGVTNEAISASVTKWDKTDENVTLSAHWEAIVYNITYRDENDKDFSGSMSGLKTTHTYDTPTDLGVGSKTGYTFKGWFTDAACTSPISILGARDYTDHITIFAKWEEIIPTSIELTITEKTIPWNSDKESENKFQVTPTVYPLDALQEVSWTAGEKNEIAKVTNYQGVGTITGLKDGTTTITCKAKNHPEVTATVTVHVTHIPILTWKDANGDVVATTKATALNGGKVTMPTDAQTATAQSCSSDYALFYGWSATPISNPTETEPTLVTSATDAPADHTYYAVFRNKEPKAEGYKVTTTLTTGKTYIFGAVKAVANATLANNTTFGAVAFTNTYNSSSPNWGQVVDLTPDANGFIAADNTSITDNCKWELESITSGNYSFKRGSNYLYLGTTAGSTSGAQSGVSTTGNCYIENVSSTCKDAFLLHPSSTSTNLLLYNTNSNCGYRMYETRSYGASMTPYIRFYEYQAADASGIKYITQCCTPLDAPAGGTATNITGTSATISWNTVTNATGYQYKIGTGEWSTSSSNTSAALTDLAPGTQYTVYLRANGTGTNCDEGTETSFTFTTLYTINAIVNNDAFGMAQVSLDNVSWSNQVAAAPGTAIYVKATNNSGYSFSAWSVEEGGAGSFDAQTSSTTFTTGAANTTIKATFLANVKVLDHITITAPTKTDYLEGDDFDPSGMTIMAYYEDGTSSPLQIAEVTITPNEPLTPDITKVTISYTYEEVTKTAEQAITVTPVYTVKWYVNGTAVKTTERVAEGATYASLDKPATPSDDALSTCEANKFMGWATSLIAKDDATEADFNAIKLNEATATISNTCKEFHAVFAKEGNGGVPKSIVGLDNLVTGDYYLVEPYNNKYYAMSGSVVSKKVAAVEVGASANDDGTISITSGATNAMVYTLTVSGTSTKTTTIKNGTSWIGGNTSKSDADMVESQTYWNVTASTNTFRLSCYTGRTLYHGNNEGFKNYSNTNTLMYLIPTSGGTSYSNFITTCKDVKSIAVQTPPTKVDYTEEETLDLTGLVVRVTYDDNSYLDITSGFTTDPANGAMLTNETKVTITYKEKTCDQAITITPLPRKTITATAPDGGTYTVKVGDGEAQTISAATTITDVIAGRTITMTSTADDQHQLHSTPFVVKDESEAEVKVNKSGNNYSFTMPESDVTITAQYVQTYTITSATGLVGGTVETDKAKTSKGSKVNVTVTPNPGYSIVRVYYVNGESEEKEIELKDDKYSFSMPASNVTVSAEFEAIKYTITLNDKGNITLKENLLYNAEVDLPALTPCYGYAFEGWTATEPTDGAWTTKPAIVAQVTVTADVTFYAVYSQGSEEVTNDYKQISSMAELESGKNYIFAAYKDWYDYSYYALKNDFTHKNNWASFSVKEVYPTNNIITTEDASIIWKIEGNSTNGYTFYNAAVNKYMCERSDVYDMDFVTSNPIGFNIDFIDNQGAEMYIELSGGDYPYFTYYNDDMEVSYSYGTNYLYKQVINSDITYTAQPDCKTLDEALIIETEPTKTIYKKGETFDKTGIEVWATFDGGTDLADVTAYIEVDETTPLTMDDTKVTVSYTQDGITATADQDIYVVDFSKIEVKDAKNIYTEGAFFDMSKLVLNAVYSSTSHDKTLKEVVTSGITVEPNRALTTSDTKVTISYNGKSVEYAITVNETQPFTVTFVARNDEYEVTETGKSAGVFVPSVTNCGDYTFVGWSKEKIIDDASSCDLVTITEGKYYPDEDGKLYAVYSYLDGGDTYNRVTDLSTIADGDKIMFYSKYNTKFIAGSNTGTYGCTASTQPVGQNEQTVTVVDENTVWTVSKSGDNYQFAHGDKLMGVGSRASTNNSVTLSLNSTYATWNLKASTSNTDYFILYQPSTSSGYAHQVNYYNNNWSLFHNDQADSYQKSFMIFKQGGTKKYTTIPDCDVEIEQSTIVLNAGSGSVDKEEYTLLKGESMTLPDPTFSITDWSFVGWSETEVKREITSAPTLVDNPFTPTKDVILNAIYSRPVGNGYVYKTYPSTLQRPSFSPEVGTYDEAKDVTITAGEGATIYYRKTTDELHHVMNSNYDATMDGAMTYSSAIKTSTTTYIVAVAQYGEKFSDEEMYKIDFNYPDVPTFSVETGSNIFKGQSVTITAPEGTLLRYKVNGGEAVELATNTYVYTFKNEVDNITLTAYSEKSGLKSEEVSATYHILPVPNKVTFHAGTGLIDGESTKEIYEDAAGEGLILPILDAPCTNGDSWKFYGWSKTSVDATTTTPTILKEGDSDCSYTAQGLRFYPTSDCDLYAVYTKTTDIVELINEDFASATDGNVASPSSTVWSGDDNFASTGIAYAYEAGQTIKLSSSNYAGYITTNALNVPVGSTLNISLDYRSYGNTPEKANVKISETNGTAEQTIAGEATDGFVTKSTTLTTTVANPTIKFAATVNNNKIRCYIDNVVITMGTPVQNYATNPECCVHTINFSTTGEAIEPVAIPCGTGNFIALPEAKKQNCNFIKWTLNTDEYSAGDIYAYDYNRTDDVTFTAVFTEPLTSVTVENGEIKYASELPFNYNGDLYVKDGGIFVADIALTVNNFVIEVGQGHAAQVKAAKNLTIHGDAYMQLEVDPADAASQGWYAFAVPFPVDALNGVYYGDTKLTNEVGYAIMDYHGDVRAQGQYGWKKYRGILQPGVFYYITLGDTDYKTLRFHLKKDGDYTIENAASKWENDQLKSEKCRTNFYPFATSGDGQITDKGWNGVANKALENVTINTNTYMSNLVYTYNNQFKVFSTEDISESPAPVFSPATPFFVVSTANEEKSFSANFQPLPAANEAPRFAPMVQAFSKVKVTLSNNAYTDKYYVSASEDAKNEYELGLDAVKMGTIDNSTKVPQIVSVNYNNTLLSAEYAQLVNGQASISLMLYAPADGEYTIAATECKDGTIYLTQNGIDIWNLKDAYTLTLNKGKVFEYGLHLVVNSGQAPTNINSLNGNNKAQKIFKDNNIYILRDAKLYNAQGTEIK